MRDNDRVLLQRLDETSKRRIAALEEALARLKEAETIAEKARARSGG